jgi:MFS family permease
MLTTWFASKERGTYWGLWNIAHNLGGFLAPIIAGLAAREFGWRWGMWVPGAMGILMGMYVLISTADSPESQGYPPVEVIKPKKPTAGSLLCWISLCGVFSGCSSVIQFSARFHALKFPLASAEDEHVSYGPISMALFWRS